MNLRKTIGVAAAICGFAVAASLWATSVLVTPARATLQVPDQGVRMGDMYSVVNAINNLNQSGSTANITAVGSAQASCVALTQPLNEVATTAASTGVCLPTAVAGRIVMIWNAGANTLSVYGSNTPFSAAGTADTINGTAGSSAYSVTTTKSALCFSPANGKYACFNN